MSSTTSTVARPLLVSSALCLLACSTPGAPGYTPHPASDSDGSLGFTPGANVDVGAADSTLIPTNPTDGDWLDFAYGVDMPGDLDGDGFGDLLVYQASLSGPDFAESIDGLTPSYNRLRVGIVYGGPDIFERDLELDAAIHTVWVWGGETAREVESDPFALLRVVPAGDVDGDGAVDLLFSVRNGGCQQGNAYLVYGGARLDGENDVRELPGAALREEGECTGYGLASPLGDLDGDGYDDFAIAAPGRTPPSDAVGRAYVYYGAPTRAVERRSEADADAVLAIDARWGGDVTPLGDIDGDGRDDVAFAVAAAPPPLELAFDLSDGPRRDYAGPSPHLSTFRVLLGGERLDGDHALESIAPALELAAAGMHGLADLNADGRAELAVVGVTDPARSVLARATVLASAGAAMPEAAWSIDAGEARVVWIESAGDVDGDARADLLLGVLGGPLGDHVALLLGDSGPWTGEVRLSSAIRFLPRSFGPRLDDALTGDAAGGSDLDGDGLDDLAFVSSEVPTGDVRAQGQVLLFRGRR